MTKKSNNQKALFVDDGFEPVSSVLGREDRTIDTFGKYYVGIDNGVSASLTFMNPNGEAIMYGMPVKIEQSYTKAKNKITRIKTTELVELIKKHIPTGANVHVIIERPMLNPTRFKASISAMRALEAVLIVVDDILHLPHSYCDSRKWQKQFLPEGTLSEELKKASLDIGNRLFPQFREFKHPDRDSLLMTEYARRNRL